MLVHFNQQKTIEQKNQQSAQAQQINNNVNSGPNESSKEIKVEYKWSSSKIYVDSKTKKIVSKKTKNSNELKIDFYEKDGKKQIGWQKVDGKLYYFYQTDTKYHKKGQLRDIKGWYISTSKNNKGKKMYYSGKDNGFYVNTKQKIKNKEYQFNTDGFIINKK